MSADGKPVMSLFLKTAGWAVFFYILVLIPSLLIERTRLAFGPDDIHIYRDYPRSIYANTINFAVYDLDKLDNYPYQVIILGASPPGRCFQTDQLMDGLKGYRVHNLAIMGANITETEEMLDLVQARVDVRKMKSAVFVLGEQFVSFIDNQRKFYGDLTNIEQEELRHHLYVLRDGKVVPVFHGSVMAAALFLVRPFVWIYSLKFDLFDGLEEARVRLAGLSDPLGGKASPQQAKTYRLLEFEGKGPTDNEFDQLGKIIDRLHATGATVVYVDMPVISYYRKDFPFYQEYRRKIKATIAAHPAARYLDLTASAPDDQFGDDTHAKPEFYGLWTSKILKYLQTVTVRH